MFLFIVYLFNSASCRLRWSYMKHCWHSLTFNAHMNSSYASDVCLTPIFWFVDNYTHCLGPVTLSYITFVYLKRNLLFEKIYLLIHYDSNISVCDF